MEKVKWTDSLSVGIDPIDIQHKELIQRLNNMTLAIEGDHGEIEISKTLDFLIDYTEYHFSAEEKFMEDNNYPGVEEHKKKHIEFTSTLSDLAQEFDEEGATKILADSIDTFMINWLVKHIQEVDIEFGKFLEDNGITISE
ncbi:MAG: bacteriohemerythrin [Candidatus Tantalella remota]|nr:bacteriohemerythrin [Candidatus Tantalella remota]